MSSRWIILFLMVFCLSVGACHRNPRKISARPNPPPAPTKLEIGNKSLTGGQYTDAVQSYEAYLRENPDAADRDEVLFKLGIAYGLAGNTPEDFNNTQKELRALVTGFPDSRYRPDAEYILSLQTEIEKLRLNARDKDTLMRDKDERIRRLTQELERMKKIDLERRPTRPPR